MIAYNGSLSIAETIPGVGAALAVSLTDLEARIAALLAFSPQPINFAASLTLATSIVASVSAAITAGLTVPSIDIQIALIAALVVALEAQLQVILDLKNIMVSAGIDVFVYDGAVNTLGSEFSAELAAGLPSGGTGATHCNALVLVTSVGATWAAMGGVFAL